jgi:ATP-dependent RNA helicase DeaD
VNFDFPEDAETFVHRTGRTGRAGKRGVAFTFVNETQRAAFEDLRRRAKVPFRQERLGMRSRATIPA